MLNEGRSIPPALAREDHGPIDGRYRVGARLGKGGAGSVYRADDLATGKSVALKILADDASARVQALFEREYYTLSGIRHPNVVEVYEYGSVAGKPYYAMELLSGSDLSGLAPVAFRVALTYVRDAAKALATLHARHLIHRDVSPRNLWLTDSGALKVLDFGALTSFGSPGDVVGTPPFVAPESLAGQALDQRTDLYALGALSYWLLTGQHAYPARMLRELPEVWTTHPLLPSARMLALGREDLPAIPDEVDGLVQSLLSHDPSARPSTAGELIDRITSIIGGVSDADSRDAADLVVARPAFVGRQRERKHFLRQLQSALSQRGGATVIEAEHGLGATRLLEELSLEARLEGAVSVCVDCGQAAALGGTLAALVFRLLDARPEAAMSAFAPYQRELSALSPALRARFGRSSEGEDSALALRTRIQDSVVAGVLAMSEQAPLVLFVDDLEHADDSAVAVLAVLAERAAAARLLVICALHAQLGARRTASIRALSRVARRLTLRPLTPEDTAGLVRSIFAEVPHLSRLVERVHRAARGSPRHVIELLRELIQTDAIAQIDGTWVLPQELPDEPFVRTRAESLAHRLTRLSGETRRVARALSIAQGFLSLAACKALAEREQREVFQALEQLTREGVLLSGEDGYRFVDESFRLSLRQELGTADAERSHLVLGRHLLAHEATSLPARIDAVVHMLEGGDTREAPAMLVQLTHALASTDTDRLVEVAPRLEHALVIFRAQGRSEHACLMLVQSLATVGYFSDRRLAERYGDEAALSLTRLTGIALAARLAPYLGRTVALLIGLLVGAFGFFRRRADPCVISFRVALVSCVGTCTALCGVAALCISPKDSARYSAMLAPFAGFGPKHPFSVFSDFAVTIGFVISDRFTKTRGRLGEILSRLDQPRIRRMLGEDTRSRYVGGGLFALGVQACWRDDADALRIADELDTMSSGLYGMAADQIRTLYYGVRGEVELFETHKHRAEIHAIKRGSAWQVETWMPGAMIAAAFRSHDAMAMKHAVEQLERLEKRTPSLSLIRKRAQGAYLVLRRRPVEALPYLEQCVQEEDAAVVGWARAHGVYARALNALGQHARAREVSERALRTMEPADKLVWAMALGVQIEHALALSGLGQHSQAVKALQGLLTACGDQVGAITLGNLHEALARATRAAGDLPQSERHFEEMTRLYRGTAIPSLATHLQVLNRERQRALGVRGRDTREIELTLNGSTQGNVTAPLMNALDNVLGRFDVTRDALANRALAFLAEQCVSRHGALWIASSEGAALAASFGETPVSELDGWVRERLVSAADDEVTQTDFLEDPHASDPNQRVFGGHPYQLLVLSCQVDGREVPVGAAVLERSPLSKFVSQDLLRALAARLLPPSIATVRTSFVPR